MQSILKNLNQFYNFPNFHNFSVKLHNPGQFVQLTDIKTHGSHEPLPYEPLGNDTTHDTNPETKNIIDDAETVADELEQMTAKMIKEVGINAVESRLQKSSSFKYL